MSMVERPSHSYTHISHGKALFEKYTLEDTLARLLSATLGGKFGTAPPLVTMNQHLLLLLGTFASVSAGVRC